MRLLHCIIVLSLARNPSMICYSYSTGCQGFMAVNEPSPRAKPEDKVCLRCHKSLATRAITVIYPI